MSAARCLVVATVVFFLAMPAGAREQSLDQWFDAELLPAVNDRLQNHPRFKGQTVMFVVIDGNEPASVSNQLALSLRDRLLNAALDTGNIRVAWRQGSAASTIDDSADCRRDTVNYYIGVEVAEQLDRRYEIRVRAMDLDDGSWIGGFGSTWRGSLSGLQQRALRDTAVDSSFLGARDVPFTSSQTDLLAKHLAHELSCALSGQTSGEYVLPMPGPDSDAVLAGALDLVSRNIAAHSSVSITTSPNLGNATLSAQAHPVDRSLHQYWLTITPTRPDSGLAPLSVSAYVVMPDGSADPDSGHAPGQVANDRPASAAPASFVSIPTTGGDPLLGPLHVLTPRDTSECRSGLRLLPTSTHWPGDQRCSLLSTTAHADAIVFVLEHQPQLGLVRLGDAECRNRTTARVVRSGDPLKFPIARFGSVRTRRTNEWLVTPDTDTYYAVAIADARAARRMANHIDRLPIRCGSSLRPGLQGESMRRWLDDFATLAARAVGAVDWRAIELKDVL